MIKKEPVFVEQCSDTFFDKDHKKCFKNAIRKKAFRSMEVKDPNNYIMYIYGMKTIFLTAQELSPILCYYRFLTAQE